MINFITKDEGFTAEGISTYTEIPSQFYSLFDNAELIAADTETTGLSPYRNKPLLLIMTANNQEWVIDCRTIDYASIVKRYKNKHWLWHNAQFDCLFIGQHTGTVLPNVSCTYQQEKLLYTLDEAPKGRYTLATLAESYCNVKMDKSVRYYFVNKPDIDPFTPEEIKYAASDTKYLESIHKAQLIKIKEDKLEYLVYVERRFITSAVRMALTGITLDTVKWRATLKENVKLYEEYEQKLKDEIRNLALTYPKVLNQRYQKYQDKHVKPEYAHLQLSMFDTLDADAVLNQINFSSSKQIKQVFEACGVYLDSINANVLKKYRAENLDTPIANFIQLYCGDENKTTPCYQFFSKQISTYGESFLKNHLEADGKIHTSFGLIETKTGRLSSGKPNMQNIPALKAFREAFVAEPGYEIYTIDYSGCELAICAQQSGCPIVRGTINDGGDLHSLMATVSYKIIKNDPTFVVSKTQNKDLRTKHKPVLFGILYGAGPSRIAEVLSIPKDVAVKVYNALQEALPALFSYLEQSAKFATTKGYIYSNTVTNRRQWFVSDKEAYKIEKEAKNYRMQATNADMVKEAICTCHAWIDKNNVDCQILLTVHDEIVFMAPKGQHWIADKMVELMEQVAKKYVPDMKLQAECDIYGSWVKGLKAEEQEIYLQENPRVA